ARNYHGVTHRSLANYVAAVTGRLPSRLGFFYEDCPPFLLGCETRRANLFRQITEKHGLSWRSYEELMPAKCARHPGGVHHLYQPKPNPAVYFSNLRGECSRYDVPLGDYVSGPLSTALDERKLPSFAFITPDMCNDTHDCRPSRGDRWLATWVTRI